MARGEVIFLSRKPGSDWPYHVGFDLGNDQILMLTRGRIATVDLNTYLAQTGYGVAGYADVSDYVSASDFEININKVKNDIERNFRGYDDYSGTVCVDVMAAGFGSSMKKLQNDIRLDYKVNSNYNTSIENSFFWRRNSTYQRFFLNTGRFHR